MHRVILLCLLLFLPHLSAVGQNPIQNPGQGQTLIQGQISGQISGLISGKTPGQVQDPDTIIPISRCLVEVDLLKKEYEQGRIASASQHLSQLLRSCSSLPHLHHNLGVIAADEQRWDDATIHFENSLKLDQRAYMTHQSLASIYRFKAAKAYKKALQLNEVTTLPSIRMQSSEIRNSEITASQTLTPDTANTGAVPDTRLPDKSASQSTIQSDPTLMQSTSTQSAEVGFEVRSWWMAQIEDNQSAWRSHYAPGLQPAGAINPTLPDYSQVDAKIDVFGQHALVLLMAPHLGHDSADPDVQAHLRIRALLVFNKSDSRWQIIREQVW